MNIYERLDRVHGLTGQSPLAPFKVLYLTSGTHLAACVVSGSSRLEMKVNNLSIPFQGFVADTKTYYCETSDEGEAYYLVSVLNSELIDRLVKPMQSRGLFGERDFHGSPWSSPSLSMTPACKLR